MFSKNFEQIFSIINYKLDILFYTTIQPQTSLKKSFNNFGIKTITNSLKIIWNLTNNKNNTHIKYKAEVYDIQCLDCNKNMLNIP